MIKAPEALNTATTESAQLFETAIHGQEESNSATSMVCDLAEASAFCEGYSRPHVPVLAAFGGGRLHVCRLEGSWDLDRAVSDNVDALSRSIRRLPSKHSKEDTPVEWDDLTFQFRTSDLSLRR